MATTSGESGAFGVLTVRAPQDSALLNVYDHDFQQVATCVGDLWEQRLKPGIYEVEAVLGGESERQLVAVKPDPTRPATIARDSWAIKLSSAIPLSGTQTTREAHETAAAEWSRQITWETQGGDSRLFVFIRTVEPEKYEHFAEGLSLLDAEGEELTDFTKGVRSDPEKGWLACTADLPHGPYLLSTWQCEQGVRYQPLWLSPGYETHVFLPSTGAPSLRDMSLSMSERGDGFRAGDDELVTAEAVLDGLQRGQCLLSPAQLDMLLYGKFQNPWLGILAAHALLLDAVPRRGLIKTVLVNLKGKLRLGDHPDVRALELCEEEPAPRPFQHPPMLWAGFKRVLQHSTRHETTVPPGSVTDGLLDGLLADGPWVAWRDPDQLSLGTVIAANLLRQERPELSLAICRALESGVLERYRAEQQQQLLQLSGCLTFDDPKPPSTISLSSGPGSPLADVKAEEVARECGIPLARAKDILRRLSEEPSLLVNLGTLSPTEQLVAGYVLNRYHQSSAPATTMQNRESLIEQVHTSLRRASAELERLASVSDRLVEEIPLKSIISSNVSLMLMTAGAMKYPRAFLIGAGGAVAAGLLARTDLGQEMMGKVRQELGRLFQTKGLEAAQWLMKVADRLASLDHAVLITDGEGEVLYTNAAFEQLKGHGVAPGAEGEEPRPLTEVLKEADRGKSGLTLVSPSGEMAEAELLRVQVAGWGAQSPPVAEIFKLRFNKQPTYGDKALLDFGGVVSNILVASSLVEHGTPELRQEYLSSIHREIKQLMPLLKEASPEA